MLSVFRNLSKHVLLGCQCTPLKHDFNRISLASSHTTSRTRCKSINQRRIPGKKFYILGIETSCDDTCAAVLDSNGTILSNVKQSQLVQHLSFGGVLPSLSFQLHARSINEVVLRALRQAGVKEMRQVATVGITTRPGLSLSLNVGLDYAKRLCNKYHLPMIPIHHMEAHALTALHSHRQTIRFPFLCLLISGGHSQLALFKRLDSVFLLGQSSDIAPGDLFDKLARELRLRNLGAPFDRISGGEAIERLAAFGRPVHLMNRQPMNAKLNCDFSYSGMASAIQQVIDRMHHQTDHNGWWSVDAPIQEVADICASIQMQVCQHLALRLHRSLKFLECTNLLQPHVLRKEQIQYQQIDYLDEKSVRLPLVISGGVACSDFITGFLRQYTKRMISYYDQSQLDVFVPRPHILCTDNAVMIAWNALLKYAYECGFQEDLINENVTSSSFLEDKNMQAYCLIKQDHIESVKIEHKASLGIDIRDLVERFNISIVPVPDQWQADFALNK